MYAASRMAALRAPLTCPLPCADAVYRAHVDKSAPRDPTVSWRALVGEHEQRWAAFQRERRRVAGVLGWPWMLVLLGLLLLMAFALRRLHEESLRLATYAPTPATARCGIEVHARHSSSGSVSYTYSPRVEFFYEAGGRPRRGTELIPLAYSPDGSLSFARHVVDLVCPRASLSEPASAGEPRVTDRPVPTTVYVDPADGARAFALRARSGFPPVSVALSGAAALLLLLLSTSGVSAWDTGPADLRRQTFLAGRAEPVFEILAGHALPRATKVTLYLTAAAANALVTLLVWWIESEPRVPRLAELQLEGDWVVTMVRGTRALSLSRSLTRTCARADRARSRSRRHSGARARRAPRRAVDALRVVRVRLQRPRPPPRARPTRLALRASRARAPPARGARHAASDLH